MELNLKTEEFSEDLRNNFYKLCGFEPSFYPFPGGMPVPIMRKDIEMIRNKKSYKYNVSEKLDGTRYMLYVVNNKMYLVNRAMDLYIVSTDVYYNNEVVLDGELIKHENSDIWEYVVFDVYAVNSRTIKDIKDHRRRINIFQENSKNINCRLFNIIPKRFFMCHDIKKHLEYAKTLPYKTDGLIFSPINRKIFNGTDRRMYKYKQVHTIDFELFDDNTLRLCDKNDKIKICNLCEEDINLYKNIEKPCIVECYLVDRKDESIPYWKIIKRRCDKNRANSMAVYLSTINIINENIMIEDIWF